LKAPVAGNYVFTSISDDGAMLEVNDKPVLVHNWDAIGDPKGDWMAAMHKEEDGF